MERLPAVLSLADLDRIDIVGTVYRPIARRLGISGFGVNAYTGERAGDEVIEPHTETGDGSGKHEELYLVLTGHATFVVDGETIAAPAGTFVFVHPEQHRVATAEEEETTVLVIGGKPGAAGPPSPFEYWYAAEPAYRAKDYERAYTITAEGLEHHADNASLQYNLACFAARAGRLDDARAHLERAFALNPRTREWAHGDADLALLHL
ncbi:MAG TPA: tetratricopeptide repeat protein [Solirubrobacter sp.]|nr:tetratricopeptide repeat protein [Solirubrobacter sp.]